MPAMHCPACAAPIDITSELPGSEVRCICGTMVSVLGVTAGGGGGPTVVVKPGPCPRCETPLVEAVTLGGLGAHACPECGGVFADRTAVAELSSGINGPVSARDNRGRKPTAPDTLKCPVCGEGMRRVNFSYSAGVIVEVCADHGTWFDALQIDRAAAFIAARGHEHGTEGPPEDGPPVSAEVDRNLGKLKAQMVGERYDEMDRPQRATWFTRFGLRLLFDWFL